MTEQKRRYGAYKKRGAVPRRACHKFTVLLEPTLALRLLWLAEKKNVSQAVLLEHIVSSNQEVRDVRA